MLVLIIENILNLLINIKKVFEWNSTLIKLVNETVKINVFQLLAHSSRLITIKAFLKYN